MAAGDWLLMQGNLSSAATQAAAAAACARGVRVAINAAPIAFDWTAILPLCDLLVVNEVEAATLCGGEDPRMAARRLAAGCDVVLTLGAAGAVLQARDAATLIAAPRAARRRAGSRRGAGSPPSRRRRARRARRHPRRGRHRGGRCRSMPCAPHPT